MNDDHAPQGDPPPPAPPAAAGGETPPQAPAGPAQDPVAAALAEVARLGADAAALTGAEQPGTALLPTGAGVDAEQAKGAMILARARAVATTRELEAARARARETIEAQRRALDAELARLAAELEPLRRHAARLEEGIRAINLYLGVGEGLVTLADGAPALAGTPVHVRQQVLAMDEESAIAADQGGIDHRHIDSFDDWITADPARVEQLIPEPRGVVAIMPRRAPRDYGDELTSAVHNQANRQTYLLIRNGDCLYRYIAEGFDAGRRLTPLRDEFTALFTTREFNPATRRYETVTLQPGTPQWEHAERAAGARERHFMRVALLLQGLVDRTAVFRPLPTPGLSLLHPRDYEAGHIVLIADDENQLTTGRPPFLEWLAERNAQLRPGMRIVGHFGAQTWRDANDYYDHASGRPDSWRHSRLHPPTASPPQTGQVYTLDRRDGPHLVFRYQRTDQVWRRDVPVPDKPGYVYTGRHPTAPLRRASARIDPNDRFVVPLDLVTIAECEAYLHSRVDRHAYATMIPVLQAVIAAKRAEAAAEEPMRQLLAGQLVTEHGADPDEAAAAIPALVDWWKLTNRRHRPLLRGEDPAAEARAVRAITAEFAARRTAAAQVDDAGTVERLRAATTSPMLIARTRIGGWIVLEPQPRALPGQPGNVWVREHTWTRTLAGHRVRDWVLPQPARTARWRVLWSTPTWAGWDHAATATEQLTDPELTDLAAAAAAEAERQAAQPYRPYTTGAAEPPLAGTLVAVHHQPETTYTRQRLVTYWLCDGPTDAAAVGARGVRGAELVTTWSGPARHRQVEHRRLTVGEWTDVPWSPRGHPLLVDEAAVAALEAALAAHRAAEQRRRDIARRARELCEAIAQQWSEAAREAARRQFLRDYGDATLWDAHSAGLSFDYPHPVYRSPEQPWQRAVERLVADTVDLAGRTVAEVAELHQQRYGQDVDVPADVAGLRFPRTDPTAGGAR